MINFYKKIFIIGLLGIHPIAGAQGDFEPNTEIAPLDTSIRHGKLPNGFTYFIKSLPDPKSKLHLRFYNKAGYNQQDPDQLNIAHAIEHLSFTATQNFPEGLPNNERLIKLGLDFNDYIEAYSGNKLTQYHFNVPPGNSEALEVGFMFFKDIAQGMKLNEKDINSVRGELRQEYLEGGEDINFVIDTKLRSKIFPCRQDYSGFIEHHKTFNPEVVRRFYKDWYRPKLLAISAVGYIEDIENLEQRIKETFSDIQPAENPPNSKNCDSLYHKRPPQFFTVERPTDPSQLLSNRKVDLQLIFRDQVTNNSLNTLRGIERLTLMQLLMEVVNKRLKEATKEYNSFYAGVRDTYQYEELPVTLKINAKLNGTEEKYALQKIIQVLHQLQKYGVTTKEWSDVKEKQLNILKSINLKAPNYWIVEIQKFYTNEEALPANKNKYLQEMLLGLSLLEFNQFINQFLSKGPEDIGIIAPVGNKALFLTEKEVRKWIKKANKYPVKPFISSPIPSALMSMKEVADLKEVEIVNKKTGNSGAKEFLLKNGLKLIIKPVKPSPGPSQDKIRIHGFTLKGAGCYPKEDLFSVIYAPSIINNSGIKTFNKFQLNDFMYSNDMLHGVVSSYIDINDAGIQGTSTIKNLEYLLQLIFLQITRPNKDKIAFEDWKYERHKADKNLLDSDFQDGIKKATGDNSVIEEVLGSMNLQNNSELYLGIEKVDLNVAYDRYKELFGNAGDFTFVVTGDFELESISPLLIKYLGNLPNSSSLKNYIPISKTANKLLSGPQMQVIPTPVNNDLQNIKYSINFIEEAVTPLDWQEQIKVEALGEISTHRAWALRFEKGYSLYSVGVKGKYNKDLNRYEISSSFECMPEEFSVIKNEVHQIFSDLKNGKILEEDFQKGMSRMYFLYDANKRASRHMNLHQNLYEHYRYQQPFIDNVEVERFVKSLTIKDMAETAEKYLQNKNLYEFTMINSEKN